MNEVLLGVLSSLVAALIFVVKWLVTRSDRNLERRDEEVVALVQVARDAVKRLDRAQATTDKAVEAFRSFEEQEKQVHTDIIERLDQHQALLNGICSSLERTAHLQQLMLDKLSLMQANQGSTSSGG